ncbi:50S ribosomal protein YmL27 [Penicillium taxi]|uniref:50S ribosomal protein YmL27 n=1 Tax=Penicillium taxi TaxID=168475 RepID=UPI00254594AE|nr:50S ribosomal protein YmL27 [Penicillium taxi]KAJ5893791.1 50S ribosomal protein YmL27 [Penicillium taxi]
MFKPTSPMMARLRLTTKAVNGGYYKGNRTGSMGYFEKKGNYVIDWRKVRTYVVPEDLADFKLTPFVSKQAQSTGSKYKKSIERHGQTVIVPDSLKGQDYINLWGERNYEEVVEFEEAEQKSVESSKETSS